MWDITETKKQNCSKNKRMTDLYNYEKLNNMQKKKYSLESTNT